MKQKKGNYFIPIQAAFLFDTFKIFKHYKTVWVYIYLKLKFSGILAFSDTPEINIDKNEASKTLKIPKPTLYKIFIELEKFGLLIRTQDKDKYLFNSENELIKILKEHGKERFSTNNAFFEIYSNFFIYSVKYLPEYTNVLLMYYYLKFKNQHYLYKIDELTSSEKLSTRTIVKEIGLSLSTLQSYMRDIISVGYVSKRDGFFVTYSEKQLMKKSTKI